MISASTNEMSAPRRYDVAGFLLAGGNRLLFVSIDASQAGGVMGQRLPTDLLCRHASSAFQAVLPLASLARPQHDAGPHDAIGGVINLLVKHHGARDACGQEPGHKQGRP